MRVPTSVGILVNPTRSKVKQKVLSFLKNGLLVRIPSGRPLDPGSNIGAR